MSLKNITLAAIAATSLSAALPTLADEGAYVGAQYAITEYEQSGTNGNDGDAKPKAFVLSAGYSFSKHVAVEGRLGFGAGDDELFVGTDVEVDQLVSLLGKFSVGGPISPYFLVGFSDVELDATGGQSTEGDGPSFGAGIDFTVADNTALSLEYIQYVDEDIANQQGEASLTAFSFGVNYKF